MALLGKFGDDYTKTGGNMFSRWSGYVSYVPVLGAMLAPVFGTIGTLVETAGWLFRGKFSSALTAATTGTAATVVNTVGGSGLAWGSAILTGRSLGTHARKLTEAGVGGVTGALGMKPQVLRSYPAGIGSIGGAATQGPGRFVSQVAQSRGEDPNAAYARLQSGQSDHLAALQAAQSQGGYRGM